MFVVENRPPGKRGRDRRAMHPQLYRLGPTKSSQPWNRQASPFHEQVSDDAGRATVARVRRLLACPALAAVDQG